MLFKFAYDGTKFYGYQRQNNLPTVEGEILKIVKKYSLGKDIKCASRTDRGVSALGNVISLDADDPEKVIGVLNLSLDHIFFYGYSDEDINPRFARERWYRYHLPDFGFSEEKLKEGAKIFVGEHDFRQFTKARDNTMMRINEINIQKIWNFYAIDFRAPYYLWNVIRRIVAAMTSYAMGNEFGEEVFTNGCKCGLAPPESLILMDVIYDFQFNKIRIKPRTKERFFRGFASGLIYNYLSGKVI